VARELLVASRSKTLPDRGGSEQVMKAINEAHSSLPHDLADLPGR
jgi:hypothetical protein